MPGTERIASERVAEIVAAGEMAVARAETRIVGSVRVRMLDEETGFFGLLAVHPDDQGSGVGRELIRFAEQLARERGAGQMELRLLVPREQTTRQGVAGRLVHAARLPHDRTGGLLGVAPGAWRC